MGVARAWMVRGAAGIAAALALAAPAQAATLEPGSLYLLTGEASLLGALPEPASPAFATTTTAVSQDGRFVAFTAGADGLSAEDDDTAVNVYVKDRLTGAVTYASRRDGVAGEPGHRSCRDASISDDGTRVAFTCREPLDPADTNDKDDVYVRDLPASRTFLASRASGLGAVGNDRSDHPVLSQTGQFVAFESQASNLVAGANGTNVYRRELGGGDAVVVASRKTGPAGDDGGGISPSISDDGNRIAFVIDRNGFYDAADTNSRSDVFVHDESADTTVLASRKDGAGAVGNGSSAAPALSGDGLTVAFESTANQFDFAHDSDTGVDVYRRSLVTGATNLVDVTIDGTKAGPARRPTIDDTGRVIGFLSKTTILDPADPSPGDDLYYKDDTAGTVVLASRADGTAGAVSDRTNAGAVSGDGTAFAVEVQRPLTPDADPRQQQLVVRDVAAAPPRTTSVARPPGTDPFRNAGGDSFGLHLSADGRFAVFESNASGLGVPDDAARAIVVRDLVTGAATVASRADGPDGAIFTSDVGSPAISADGSRVAFLVATGTGQLVYVRDLVAGRTFLASRADGPDGATAMGSYSDPVLDADGSRVAFETTAVTLGDGDADAIGDIHLRDLETGRTLLVSRATGADGAKGNADSRDAAISADGTRVGFVSKATNLGDGDTDVDLDASGTRAAFTAMSTNLLGLTPARQRVFVRDLAGGTLVLASRADGAGGAQADANSNEASISPDGGFVAFGSEATNLAAPVEAGAYEVYRRDLAGGRTALASRGNPASVIDYPRNITTGGACVAFEALETLVGPHVDGEQGYVRAFERDCGRPPPPPPGGGAGGGGSPGGGGTTPGGGGQSVARDVTAPVLARARLSRRRFAVGPRATALRARTARGTVLRLTSSEAARLTLRFERPSPGRRATSKGRRVCRPVRRRPRTRACTAFRAEGTPTRQIRAGAVRIALSGRIGRRALRLGAHRLTLVATDAAGNRSRAVRLAFRIVR
ncbi:MAG: PD40 domain-containing protein [Solirubrobacterales bacterium]|nr:PD40 domain-containing protein [Solirubrobacterales bacterium]